MVDVCYSPDEKRLVDGIIPEDNVDRLRSIRDMFENPTEMEEQLQEVKRVAPSEKLMERLTSVTTTEMHDFDDLSNDNKLENRAHSLSSDESIGSNGSDLEVEEEISPVYTKTLTIDEPVMDDENVDADVDLEGVPIEEEEAIDDSNLGIEVEDDEAIQIQEVEIMESMDTSEDCKDQQQVLEDTKTDEIKEDEKDPEEEEAHQVIIDEECTSQSSSDSATSSVSSISSTNADDENLAMVAAEHFTVENCEVKEHLHAESITDFNNESDHFRFKDGTFDHDEDNEENEMDDAEYYEHDLSEDQTDLKTKRYARKKEKVIPLHDMNNIMSKFQNLNNDHGTNGAGPKPVRHITPPRIKALYEIENTPAERAEGVVGANDKIEDVKPTAGFIRSRKQAFALNNELDNQGVKTNFSEDIVPGSAKNIGAMFAEDRWAERLKKIEKSGITLEGDIVEKGLAQERSAMFNDEGQTHFHKPSVAEIDLEILESAKGLAKDRMNMFNKMEKKGENGNQGARKLKEFTPPPTMDGQPPRQYVIVSKETSPSGDQGSRRDSYTQEEFVPEAGLTKNRMKQYLESQEKNSQENKAQEEVVSKGYARNMMNKWKSMETVEGAAGGRRLSKEGSPGSVDHVNQDGGQIHRVDRSMFENGGQDNGNHALHKTVDSDQELVLIGKGSNKNRMAKFEQSVNESSKHVRKTVTPPREYITRVLQEGQTETVYESNPADSLINSQFCEEDVIPSAGHAKNLRAKFLNMEKEASKVETSSSKMNYKPKKFTSAAHPQSNLEVKEKEKAQIKRIDASRIADAAQGPEKALDTSAKDNAINTYLQHHTSSLHGGDKCCQCEKTVYAMEKIEANKNIYHKSCFKCTSCNCPLNDEFEIGRFIFDNSQLFCLKCCAKKQPAPISPSKKAPAQPVPAEPASPSKKSQPPTSPAKSKVAPLASIHIDTTSSFESDSGSSMKSPMTPTGSSKRSSGQFSPISPMKQQQPSPKNSPRK